MVSRTQKMMKGTEDIVAWGWAALLLTLLLIIATHTT